MEDNKPTIFIGSDHAGFELKNVLIEHLQRHGYEVIDKGPETFDKADDYPDFIFPVAQEVSEDPDNRRGIILGGSGQGEAIAANKVSGIRATVYYGGSEEIIRLSRSHNDANVLSLGSRFLTDDEAKRVVIEWLDTSFEGAERHVRRIEKIKAWEERV